jgi:hypothetical protein
LSDYLVNIISYQILFEPYISLLQVENLRIGEVAQRDIKEAAMWCRKAAVRNQEAQRVLDLPEGK